MTSTETGTTNKHVMETVTFKLNEGTTREEFAAAAMGMNDWVAAQPGFVRRRLSCTDDGTWVEQIEWASMDDAKGAASKIGKEPGNTPFLKAIDGPSAKLMHSEVEVAIN